MTARQVILTGALLLAPAAHAGVAASSALVDEAGVRHDADAAFDGLLQTSWCEGEPGVGEGSWIELRLAAPTALTSISIWPGDLSNGERSLEENGRPKVLRLSIDGGEPRDLPLRDGAQHGEQRADFQIEGEGEAHVVRLTVADASAGFLHNDTCIAEVGFDLASGDHAAAPKIDAWLASASGQKAVDAHRAAVIERFDRIDSSEFGDRDALRELMDWAADGAPYLRDRVRREVTPGFRVGALPPDDVAVEALLKIKDANAIPAIKLASLRRTGDAQRRLAAAVDYFEAFTELSSGGRRSLPTWGAEGWEKGALRSFGEPSGIARSSDGRLFVADVANHRVVVFDENGNVLRQWGKGEPVVTDAWFDGHRTFYVAGRQPTAETGGFTNPVAITLREDHDGVHAYVLDATSRVQIFDEDGHVTATVALPAELGPTPGVGGVGHLVTTRKGVVAIVGTEGWSIDSKGRIASSFHLDEGAPTTVAVLKSGHLAVGRPGGASEVDVSGYRVATLLSGDDLPLGTEAWTIATDEKGAPWLVTDNGWVVAYKKPGTEAFRVRWSKSGGRAPRFVVDDGILWIVADGRITRFDALEAKAQADAGGDE